VSGSTLPEPMSAAQLAAVRACALLAERYEPLTMTPGDLRTLLGRYQRRLHDLAEAVLPAAATAGDTDPERPSSPENASALAHLHATWQDSYYLMLADGIWSASPHADRTVILTARRPWELRTKIQDHYSEAMTRSRAERSSP